MSLIGREICFVIDAPEGFTNKKYYKVVKQIQPLIHEHRGKVCMYNATLTVWDDQGNRRNIHKQHFHILRVK